MTDAASCPRPTPETWDLIRSDYRSGISAPVLAERYGVAERTLRRRAALERWRRSDPATPNLTAPPAWLTRPVSREEALEADPDLAEVDEAEGSDRLGLLFDPDAPALRVFAFRRASEAAAMERPQEAVAWMRLLQMVDRVGDRVEDDIRPLRKADHLRAACLRQMRKIVASLPDDPEAEDDADRG